MARIEFIGSRTVNRAVRKVLPRSLLGRSLLMILLPLILLQAVALQIFYGSHLDLVSRRLSGGVVSEIMFTLNLLNRYHDPQDRKWILTMAHRDYDIVITLDSGARLPDRKSVNILGPMDDELTATLRSRFHGTFLTDWTSSPKTVFIQMQLPDGVLHAAVPRKSLYAGSIYVFVAWLAGVSMLVFGIAALFMRNQVRAIRRLAAAAEAFGIGRDIGPIKPEGAVEVRKAASAFNRMQERIRRFLLQRTEMLAGVSHDLRTPLTRLRLAVEVMQTTEENQQDLAGMKADVEEMDGMIAGYLAFARGERTEQAESVNLSSVLEEVAAAARRAGAVVALDVPPMLTLSLRANAVRRAVTNLVDNARRHAKHIGLAALLQGRSVLVLVDDDGPGIPPERRESVFRPFESGAAGGTGLGLAIARDIVRAHGGDIALEDSPLGGLRARIRLPV